MPQVNPEIFMNDAEIGKIKNYLESLHEKPVELNIRDHYQFYMLLLSYIESSKSLGSAINQPKWL